MSWLFCCHDLQTYYRCTYPEGSGKGNCGACWTVSCEEPSDKSVLNSEIYKPQTYLNKILCKSISVQSSQCQNIPWDWMSCTRCNRMWWWKSFTFQALSKVFSSLFKPARKWTKLSSFSFTCPVHHECYYGKLSKLP